MEENNEKQIEEAKPIETESKEIAPSPLEEAKNILKKIEEANNKTAELLLRQEQLQARDLLSGRSLAGQVPEKPKEETPAEYAARILRGGK